MGWVSEMQGGCELHSGQVGPIVCPMINKRLPQIATECLMELGGIPDSPQSGGSAMEEPKPKTRSGSSIEERKLLGRLVAFTVARTS